MMMIYLFLGGLSFIFLGIGYLIGRFQKNNDYYPEPRNVSKIEILEENPRNDGASVMLENIPRSEKEIF